MQTPTRSVNGGCVIMVTGLAAFAYSALAGYTLWKISHAVDPEKYQELIHTLTWHCIVSTLLGIALLVLGWRFAKQVNPFDPNDPDEPMMKF